MDAADDERGRSPMARSVGFLQRARSRCKGFMTYTALFAVFGTLSLYMVFRNFFFFEKYSMERPPPRKLAWYEKYHSSWGNSTITKADGNPPEAGVECGLPRVVFLIPYYSETEGALQRTVKSIVGQEGFYWHFAIVISDDGGPRPEVPQKVVEWMANLRMLRTCCFATIVRGANGQLPMARNRAFASIPEGVEWVVPVDTGDTLASTFMQMSAVAAERTPGAHVVHPHLCTLQGYQWDPPNIAVAKNPLHVENLFHCCPMFRRHIWDAVGGYDSSFVFGWEDWDFWVRANASVGLVAVNLPARCLYMYDPGESHGVCVKNHAVCKAAFRTAHGNLNSVEDTLAAHTLLLQSPAFLGNDELQRQQRRHPEMPLTWLWTGMLREAQGDTAAALRQYEGAMDRHLASHPGMLRTRGVGWQAAYRGAKVLRDLQEQSRLGEWCRRAKPVLEGRAEVVGCTS